ncbi:MAG: LysM peptidoglycan-binding domain-containing protein [Sulfobacillus thermotolerans]|uniref:Peptidoglycan endopeptidase n=1 Tax=Sulfobacillus thermotolerans TaxID=338644 RepID=A0ABN5H009_9FIRM|nr:peptidoglycan endopeptidase [Sulfobacillus thermotolerans]MCY0908565.1 LysM peptidoglycan-binding domain-containing protein [Sulfobacillus thermotolerans]
MNLLPSKKAVASMAVGLMAIPFAMGMSPTSHHTSPSPHTLAAASASATPRYLSARMFTVQPGDTLSSIAWQFHTTVSALATLNHIANPNEIRVGQVLTIGYGGADRGTAVSSAALPFTDARSTYTVQPGNTLGGIAFQFHVTVSQLMSWNNLSNPNFISVGQVLTIAGPAAQAPSTPAPAPSASGNRSEYVVQAGNTLAGIAQQFGLSWETLASYNHLSNPNVLNVGQVLAIPSGAQASTSAAVQLPAQNASISFGQAIVQTAERYLGVPYVWGGASPATGFDCSGLVQYVFQQNGIPMPRTSWAQYDYVTKIPESQLQPGDLVFFSTDGPGASHVGIYIGSDPSLGYSQAFIEAPAPGQTVMVSNLDAPFYVDHYYGAGFVNQ